MVPDHLSDFINIILSNLVNPEGKLIVKIVKINTAEKTPTTHGIGKEHFSVDIYELIPKEENQREYITNNGPSPYLTGIKKGGEGKNETIPLREIIDFVPISSRVS